MKKRFSYEVSIFNIGITAEIERFFIEHNISLYDHSSEPIFTDMDIANEISPEMIDNNWLVGDENTCKWSIDWENFWTDAAQYHKKQDKTDFEYCIFDREASEWYSLEQFLNMIMEYENDHEYRFEWCYIDEPYRKAALREKKLLEIL
jgi:hypothetical protein